MSYTSTPLPSPALKDSDDHLRRRRTPTKRRLRSKLLFVLVTVLLAICVYASFIDDSMGEAEAAISCAFCLGLLMPLQALAHVGDDAFVDFFVGFCINLGVRPSVAQSKSRKLIGGADRGRGRLRRSSRNPGPDPRTRPQEHQPREPRG